MGLPGSLEEIASLAGTNAQFLLLAFSLLLLPLLWNFLTSPVKSVPGPFLAKCTNLWRFHAVWRRDAEKRQEKLHQKYGPAVAVGPNMVSINDPELIKVIYSRKEVLLKSDFYSVNDMMVEGHQVANVFSTRDEQENSRVLKPAHRVFAMNHVIGYEHLIDKTIDFFFHRLDEEFVEGPNEGDLCDMDNWLHYFAWDVIAETTFSRRMGFLDEGRDVDDILRTGYVAMDYFSLIGQMPFLDRFLDKNRYYRMGPPNMGATVGFCLKAIAERRQGLDGHASKTHPDFLDSFLETQEQEPEVVSDNILLAYVMINVVAGSDTVASTLRAAVYHLASNPRVLTKLQRELDTNKVRSPVSWTQAQDLPYLDAVIREAFRIAPGVPHILERVVGPNGLRLPDGKFLRPGTIIGINPYVINHNKAVYGEDAGIFRPERWLRTDKENTTDFAARLSLMRATDLTFGSGKRVCLGKQLALLEVYKLIGSLCNEFDFAIAPGGRPWKTRGSWFMLQTGLDLQIKRRARRDN